jgi:hypothetical protein
MTTNNEIVKSFLINPPTRSDCSFYCVTPIAPKFYTMDRKVHVRVQGRGVALVDYREGKAFLDWTNLSVEDAEGIRSMVEDRGRRLAAETWLSVAAELDQEIEKAALQAEMDALGGHTLSEIREMSQQKRLDLVKTLLSD